MHVCECLNGYDCNKFLDWNYVEREKKPHRSQTREDF